MSRSLVVVNPAAGGGRGAERWKALETWAGTLADFDVAVAPGPGATREAVLRAVAGGCERVVSFGGDGTAHLVGGALLASGVAARVTLGIVPAGTGSDLARALGVPRDPRAALPRALLGPPTAIDAGRCDTAAGSSYFANIASAGISGLVDEKVNAVADRGATAFLRATLAALREYRCVPVAVALDGKPWFEGPMLVLAVANGTTFGKGMRVAPTARLDDGLFDVVLAGELTRAPIAVLLPRLYVGRHLGSRHVRHARASRVTVRPLAPLPVFDMDGEPYDSCEAEFTVLPAALRVAGEPAPRR
ncbi:MAG: diacylglycerol kinase family protein [Acidobacteriota bacterium]